MLSSHCPAISYERHKINAISSWSRNFWYVYIDIDIHAKTRKQMASHVIRKDRTTVGTYLMFLCNFQPRCSSTFRSGMMIYVTLQHDLMPLLQLKNNTVNR